MREPALRGTLLAMAGELIHRGPDGTGLYLDGRFGMASTRLAVVDLERGDQPLSTEDGRFWVMQNGEIYNHVELRRELEALGHAFATACDTEVIAHAYEEWGDACLGRFNGDFAFAVWDRRERELFLARDRFGTRPLFLAELGGGLAFASEAKALLRHPAARRSLDPAALVDVFTMWSVLPDRSAFEGIRELAPAHYLRWGPEGPREERRWWDLEFVPSEEGSAEELERELRDLLVDATRIRLRADVPVAAYVSGGLDSTAIAAMAQSLSSRPLSTFGIGFDDARYDESAFQDAAARAVGAPLTRTVVRSREIADLLPQAVWLWEKPTLRTALAPMLRLSAMVEEAGLKVVLTGEGADELFAGYDIFREVRVRRFWARDPDSSLRPRLLARLNGYLAHDLGRSGGLLASFYGRTLSDTDDPLYSHRIRFANTARCLRLLKAPAGDPLERLRARLPEGFERFSPLGRAQYLEVATFLSAYLLHAQGDRMLMGHSVEGRFPYLDHRVAEFAARLPDTTKMRGLREKVLLRRAVASFVPAEIGAREKRPYRAPILRALLGEQRPEYVGELLQPRRVAETGLFDADAVAALVRKCEQRLEAGVGETEEMALVGVLSTMLVHELFVARPTLAPAARPTRVVVGSETAREPVGAPA